MKNNDNKDNFENFENLANSIIVKAVYDYQKACEIIKHSSDQNEVRLANKEKVKIIKFIESSYYEVLTNVPKDIILKRLNQIEKEVMKSE